MPKQKEFNKEFFKEWSGDMAYILGFLFADGNIIKTKRNTHFVGWYSADFELLNLMAKIMESTHKISERKSEKGKYYVLQIGSKDLFVDLVKLGLTPSKAKRMKLPIIPEEFIGNFIRGYFDGDGNVWSGKIHRQRIKDSFALQVCFTSASFDFLSGLLLILKKLGVSGGSLFKSKNKRYGRLSFSTLDSLKIYEIMYNDSTKLFLSRKKLVFETFKQMRP